MFVLQSKQLLYQVNATSPYIKYKCEATTNYNILCILSVLCPVHHFLDWFLWRHRPPARNSFLGRCDCLGSTCAMSEPVQAASENRPKQWPIGIIECCRPIFSFSSTVHLNPWVDGFRVGWSSQVVFVGTNIGTTVQEVDGDNNDPVQDNYYWIPTCRDVLLLIPG